MLLPFVIFAVLLVLVLLIALFILYPGAEKISTIPGLDPINEIEGNLPDIKKAGSLSEFLVNLHREFGPIASFWYKQQYTVSIASPELFKETAHLFDRPALLFADIEPLLGESSIQYGCGPEAQARRKLQDRAFSHDAIVKKISLFQEVGSELADKWTQMSAKGEHIPLSAHMYNVVLKILSRFSFGDYFKDDKMLLSFRKDYDETFRILDTIPVEGPLVPGSDREKKFKAARERMREHVKQIISQRENSEVDPEQKSFIDYLIGAYDNEDQLFSDVLTYLIGGFHTTSSGLTWVFYFLAKYPEIQERCYEEIQSFCSTASPDWNGLKQLKYNMQVFNECMRLTRIATFATRFCTHDMVLGGHKVPKNTPIIQSLCAMAVDEDLWEDPTRFDPDRFSDERKPKNFVFEPFGFAGKRKCPGYRLTEIESLATMCLLLQKFKVSLVPGQKIEFKYELVTQPSEEVWITVEPRVDPEAAEQ